MGQEEQSPVGQEDVSANVEPTPKVETTPTTEEQLKSLQTQLEQIKQEKQKSEESYKGLQRTLNKTNEDFKRQSDLKQEIAELKEAQKIFAAMLVEKGEENPDGMSQDKKRDLLTKFEQLEQSQEAKRKQREIETQRQSYIQQADDIWAKAKSLGLPEDDDNLLDIEDYLKQGNLKRAEVKIKKLEAAKKPVVEVKKESDEDRINKLVQERLNKVLEEKGLLKTDTAVPSGRSVGNADIIRRYAEGDASISEMDYLKATGRG